MRILLVDTSVLLNVLNVPAFSQNHEVVSRDLAARIAAGVTLLLPLAAVFETGKHIAQLSNGRQRRRYGDIFARRVKEAVAGTAPWRPMTFPDQQEIAAWMDGYPDQAMRGLSLADVSIIKDWERTCRRNPRARVSIWSADGHLAGYDREL